MKIRWKVWIWLFFYCLKDFCGVIVYFCWGECEVLLWVRIIEWMCREIMYFNEGGDSLLVIK